MGLAALLLLSILVAPPARGDGLREVARRQVAPGLDHVVLDGDGPELAVHVARRAPGAPVDLRAVLSNDRIAEDDAATRRELTSSMCNRAAGALCVNGDFATCPQCGLPFGGVVVDGRPLRSFHPAHEQLSMRPDGTMTTDRLVWAGSLRARFEWDEEPETELTDGVVGPAPEPTVRVEEHGLALEGLNLPMAETGVVVYSGDWADRTQTPPGTAELTVQVEGPLRPGVLPAAPTGLSDAGNGAIAPGTVVVGGRGEAAERIRSFWQRWHGTDADRRSLVVDTALSFPAAHSVGGHPVLLRNGSRAPLDDGDPKVSRRHPRTLAGWTASGELLLVTVDGRQAGHSEGVTLHEATDLLQRLGATDAINLDGGGSSAMVVAGGCGGPERCVVNRPSDGKERPVTVALALVPRPGTAAAQRSEPTAPAPPPPPQPPVPADPASNPPVVLPATTDPAGPPPVDVAATPEAEAPAEASTGDASGSTPSDTGTVAGQAMEPPRDVLLQASGRRGPALVAAPAAVPPLGDGGPHPLAHVATLALVCAVAGATAATWRVQPWARPARRLLGGTRVRG